MTTKKSFFIPALVFFLNLFDGLFTYYWIDKLNLQEVNPINVILMDKLSLEVWLVLKICLGFVFFVIIYRCWNHVVGISKLAVWVTVVIYVFLLFYHLFGLLYLTI